MASVVGVDVVVDVGAVGDAADAEVVVTAVAL